MNHRHSLALLILLGALASPLGARADEGDAKALVRQTLEALPRVPFVAKVKLSGDVRSDRELTVHHKIIDGVRATYIEATAPANLVGIRFLLKERVGEPPKQYMRYVASTMPVMISSEMRAEAFLGSMFYLADIAEPDLNAYNYSFVGEETINGRRCKLVEAVPLDASKEVYGKVVHAIDPKDLVVVRRRFFDKKGQAIKEWNAKKLEKVSGYWTVRDQTMKDILKDMESRIEMTEITYGTDSDDSMFTKEYLVRK